MPAIGQEAGFLRRRAGSIQENSVRYGPTQRATKEEVGGAVVAAAQNVKDTQELQNGHIQEQA